MAVLTLNYDLESLTSQMLSVTFDTDVEHPDVASSTDALLFQARMHQNSPKSILKLIIPSDPFIWR